MLEKKKGPFCFGRIEDVGEHPAQAHEKGSPVSQKRKGGGEKGLSCGTGAEQCPVR